jgi:maleylacetate reductase
MPSPPPELPVGRLVHEQLSQRVVFGWGRIAELAGTQAPGSRARTPHIRTIDERDRAEVHGNLAPSIVTSIPKVRAHVPAEDVANARLLASENRVDTVVTAGGGSATGLGKAVAVGGPRLLAIPTTYAGSEMTPIYGITSDRRKKTDRDPRALPRTVIYDPELTVSLPPQVTAATGLNALAHCIEALYAQAPSPVSQLLAQEGIRILATSLPVALANPEDRRAREGALYGASLAGTVLAATGMAIHHRICHVLGGTFGLSHGDVNAVVLPHVVAFNQTAAPGAVERVANSLGEPDAATAIWDLARRLRAPTSLEELGFEVGAIDKAATFVVEGDHYNPRSVTQAEVSALLRRAFRGSPPVAEEEMLS